MENFKENEVINIGNINNNDQANSKNESTSSTRINSSSNNNGGSNIQIDGREFLLNNFITNDENEKDLDKKFMNKKRKLKK